MGRSQGSAFLGRLRRGSITPRKPGVIHSSLSLAFPRAPERLYLGSDIGRRYSQRVRGAQTREQGRGETRQGGSIAGESRAYAQTAWLSSEVCLPLIPTPRLQRPRAQTLRSDLPREEFRQTTVRTFPNFGLLSSSLPLFMEETRQGELIYPGKYTCVQWC